MSAGDTPLAREWLRARRKMVKLLPRGERDRFDQLVLALLALTTPPWRSADPRAAQRDPALLRVGVATAAALARHAPEDPELLAAAATLPWFDQDFFGIRGLLHDAAGPLDWCRAMVLACVPAGSRSTREAEADDRSRYVRQLAVLPPLLRAATLLTRHHAAAEPEITGPLRALPTARPFDPAELAALAPGLPADLVPPPGPAGPPGLPAPPPVGSPAEAVTLVRAAYDQPFGAYRLYVDGDPGFRVDAHELLYLVRWDVPPEAVRELGPPRTNPGDPAPVRYREPGWRVDRATREVSTVDLALDTPVSLANQVRTFPLPPGWHPGSRGPLPEALGAWLATLLPPPLAPPVTQALTEAVSRYAARLSTEDWPDFLVGCRVAAHTIVLLGTAGLADPDVLLAALLIATGPAPADRPLAVDSPLWTGPAGELARAAAPDPLAPDSAEAARRLAGAPAPVRALALANANARRAVETELFGVTPQARLDELAALATVARDLPGALLPATAPR